MVKRFDSAILQLPIWAEPYHVRVVWIATRLGAQDAATAGVTEWEYADALERISVARPDAKASRATRSRALPPDWSPTDAHRAMAASLFVSCADEAERFRDHFAANGKGFVDWDAAFRNWLRRSGEWRAARQPAPTHDAEAHRRKLEIERRATAATHERLARQATPEMDGALRAEMDGAWR